MNHADNDISLITEILAGDKTLYSQLVEKHKDYAFTIALNILGNREDAEEVAHDAFIKAFDNLSKFNREAKFSTWLYRIVFNTAISRKRKKRVLTSELGHQHEFSEHSPQVLEVQDQKKYIHHALNQLNAADKTAITLFYLKEHSIEEIAEITEMTESTVKVRLHRARKRLADQLKNVLKEEALTL